MDDPTVYRSEHPNVLGAWLTWKADMAGFGERLRLARPDLDPDGQRREVIALNAGGMGRASAYAVGLAATDADRKAPPKGYRVQHIDTRSGGSWVLMPDRRYKAGKEADALLDSLKVGNLRLPGMPRETWVSDGGGRAHIYSPGVSEHGGVVFAKWAVDPDEDTWEMSDCKVDGDLWDRCPLSEFYALTEAVAS